MLVAGVSSASLGLIYAAIAVSLLATVTLGAGVLLRRRELFGEAGAADAPPGRAAADTARAWPAGARPAGVTAGARAGPGTGKAGARTAAGDRVRPGRDGSGDDRPSDGERKAGGDRRADGDRK